MKKFTKVLTFMTLAGAALAGLWYFLKRTEVSDDCVCEDDETEGVVASSERSYVSLDKVVDAVVTDEEKVEAVKETIANAEEKVSEAKATITRTVKSVAQDMIKKAEDKAKGIGLVKDDKDASDFAFDSFDESKENAEAEE